MPEKQIKATELEKEIRQELDLLRGKLLRPISNRSRQHKVLTFRLKFLKWCNKKLELSAAPQPQIVKQREIFYCELGQNIGSEQDGRRPVVILQNNVGNAHAKITLIAPITSFGKGDLRTLNGQLFLSIPDKSGEPTLKKLNFYDIPVELEAGAKYPISGVINISQIRVISKSRLALTPVGSITEHNFHEVVAAIDKNISIFEDFPNESPKNDKIIDNL